MKHFRRSVIGMAGALLLSLLGGCSSSQPAGGTTQEAAVKHAELTFDLNKCQSQGAGLYKCPAMDKAICSPDYNGPPIECLRVGKKGNIYVQEMEQY